MTTHFLSTALVAALVGGASAAVVHVLARDDGVPSASASLTELRLRRLEGLAHAARGDREQELERLATCALEALASDGPVEGDAAGMELSARIERAMATLREEDLREGQAIGRALDEAVLEARLQRLCELAPLDLEQAWQIRARLERR